MLVIFTMNKAGLNREISAQTKNGSSPYQRNFGTTRVRRQAGENGCVLEIDQRIADLIIKRIDQAEADTASQLDQECRPEKFPRNSLIRPPHPAGRKKPKADVDGSEKKIHFLFGFRR
jgi:hypothetical protein